MLKDYKCILKSATTYHLMELQCYAMIWSHLIRVLNQIFVAICLLMESLYNLFVRTDRLHMYCIALYCIVLYCIVLYCIVLYCIVLYCIVLYCTVLYCIVLYCNVLYCIVLYFIVLCSVVWHYFVLFLAVHESRYPSNRLLESDSDKFCGHEIYCKIISVIELYVS